MRVLNGNSDDYVKYMQMFEAWRLQEWSSAFFLSRYLASQIRLQRGDDAVSITPMPPVTRTMRSELERDDAVQVTVNSFPVPDEQTSWQQIFDFRKDPDSVRKHTHLKLWIRELARSGFSPQEAAEKLERLMHEYTHHMEVHRLKTKQGMLEAIVTTTTEVAENIATFKWSKAAKILFSVSRRHVHLLEEEAKAPGREVAYVVKAKATF